MEEQEAPEAINWFKDTKMNMLATSPNSRNTVVLVNKVKDLLNFGIDK